MINLNVLVAIFTGIAAIAAAVSAWQSKGAVREMAIQTGIGLMPLPVIYIRRERPTQASGEFRIRNLGYGPMLNVNIEEFRISAEDTGQKFMLRLSVPPPNILKVDEERDLLSEMYINGVRQHQNLLYPHLDPEYADRLIPLDVTFEDIRGTRYKVTIGMGKGKLSVLKPPEVLRFKNSSTQSSPTRLR